MIGRNQSEYIAEAFQRSKDDGKPWQIFGDQTLMASNKVFLEIMAHMNEFTAAVILTLFVVSAFPSSDPVHL